MSSRIPTYSTLHLLEKMEIVFSYIYMSAVGLKIKSKINGNILY